MLILALTLTAHAADIYVGAGLEHDTVEQGIVAANDGDTIYLLPGTYPVADIELWKDLTIVGLGGWAQTTLQVNGESVGLFIDGADVRISHLTFQMDGTNRGIYAEFGAETDLDHVRFTGGGGAPGGCASLSGDSTLHDVHFEDCEAAFTGGGGGLYYQGQTLVIDSSTFTDNEAFTGAGLRCNGRCEVSRSLFTENNSLSGGGAVAVTGRLELRTSRVCSNDAGNGGAFWLNGGTIDIENSVVWNNTATNGGAIYVISDEDSVGDIRSRQNVWGYNTGGTAILAGDYDDLVFNNEVVVHHPQLFAAERVADDNSWTFDSYVDWNNTGGFLGTGDGGRPVVRTGGIFANPLLANNSRNNCSPDGFVLGAGSPAIDAGTGTDSDGSTGDLGPFGGANPWLDVDNDGVFAPEDCNDDDPSIHPGAAETCNGQDDNCDGIVDGGSLPQTNFWPDADGDGAGVGTPVALCAAAPNMATQGGDCDDTDPAVGPNATELCDGRDQDCDGVLDNGFTQSSFYPDNDADGYGSGSPLQACSAPENYAAQSGDCDDSDPRYNPGALEADCTDPADYNCDGSTGFTDNDSDSFAACEECNDGDSSINPRASEFCDGVDQNCDGIIDNNAIDTVELAQDDDRDGYGNPAVLDDQCPGTSGWVDDRSDCDDSNPAIHPGVEDIAGNGIDEDCNGEDQAVGTDERADRSGCTSLSIVPGWLLLLPLVAVRRRSHR